MGMRVIKLIVLILTFSVVSCINAEDKFGLSLRDTSDVASTQSPPDRANPAPVYVGPPEFFAQPYEWVEINSVGMNTGIHGDDQNLGPFPIGFDFPWYDNQIRTSVRVCSNGWLSFTSSSTAYSNRNIPNSSQPNNLVAPYWDDLYPPSGGNIWYYHDAANVRFIVEFDGVPHISGNQPYRFEAILYPNGIIDFMYNTLGEIRNSCTVGIENASGTVGIQTTYNGSGPLEPQIQTGIRIMGPFVRRTLEVTLTLHNAPMHIPAGGGFITFDASIVNQSSDPMVFDGWTELILPNGNTYGPMALRSNISIAPGQVILRQSTQLVPGSAPAGVYTYVCNAGTYPDTVVDDDNFQFTKLAGNVAPNHNQGWACYGWDDEKSHITNHKSKITNLAVSPNPFNPATNINFTLPEAGEVTLSVFDVTGREVAILANDWLNSGAHQVVFNGSDLASGVYFYTLQAGDFRMTKKVVLMK